MDAATARAECRGLKRVVLGGDAASSSPRPAVSVRPIDLSLKAIEDAFNYTVRLSTSPDWLSVAAAEGLRIEGLTLVDCASAFEFASMRGSISLRRLAFVSGANAKANTNVKALNSLESAVAVRDSSLSAFSLEDVSVLRLEQGFLVLSRVNASVVVERAEFSDSAQGALAFFAVAGNITVRDAQFLRLRGVAVSVQDGLAPLAITSCQFLDVSSAESGGAVAVRGSAASVSLRNCSFVRCTSGQRGGAVAVSAAQQL